MNTIDALLLQGTQVMVPAQVVKDWLDDNIQRIYRKAYADAERSQRIGEERNNDKQVYSIKEAGKLLGHADAWVRNLCKSGGIPCLVYKRGYKITGKAINDYIAKNTIVLS